MLRPFTWAKGCASNRDFIPYFCYCRNVFKGLDPNRPLAEAWAAQASSSSFATMARITPMKMRLIQTLPILSEYWAPR